MVTCYVKSCNTMFAAVYRPPGADTPGFKRLLEKLQQRIDIPSENSTTPDIYIVGDFNYPDIDWQSEDKESTVRGYGSDLIEFMNRHFLTQIVDKATRGGNTLDLVLTIVPRYVHEVKARQTPLSDHNLVEIQLGFDMLNTRAAASRPNKPRPIQL